MRGVSGAPDFKQEGKGNMKTTLDTVKKASKALRTPVNAVILAQAHAELMRAKCDTIQRRLLGEREYFTSAEWEPRLAVKRVVEPRLSYLMSDEDSAVYLAALDAAYREAGYTELEPGQCPALIAEHLLMLAERALFECAERFFPEIQAGHLYGANRKKYLELLQGMVVNAPGYKAPKLAA